MICILRDLVSCEFHLETYLDELALTFLVEFSFYFEYIYVYVFFF